MEGSLDDEEVIAKEVAEADIIVRKLYRSCRISFWFSLTHTITDAAASGHIKSVQTIHETLKKRSADGKPGMTTLAILRKSTIITTNNFGKAHWIQISGASALAAPDIADKSWVPGSPSDVVYNDLDGIAEICNVIKKHATRVVDNYILSVGTDTPQVNTALIFPPIIYGTGHGPGNQRSIQIPSIAKATLERKRGLVVGKGQNKWGAVHIHDVGRLALKLVEKAVAPGQDSDQVWNENGIYFFSPEETVRALFFPLS